MFLWMFMGCEATAVLADLELRMLGVEAEVEDAGLRLDDVEEELRVVGDQLETEGDQISFLESSVQRLETLAETLEERMGAQEQNQIQVEAEQATLGDSVEGLRGQVSTLERNSGQDLLVLDARTEVDLTDPSADYSVWTDALAEDDPLESQRDTLAIAHAVVALEGDACAAWSLRLVLESSGDSAVGPAVQGWDGTVPLSLIGEAPADLFDMTVQARLTDPGAWGQDETCTLSGMEGQVALLPGALAP